MNQHKTHSPETAKVPSVAAQGTFKTQPSTTNSNQCADSEQCADIANGKAFLQVLTRIAEALESQTLVLAGISNRIEDAAGYS